MGVQRRRAAWWWCVREAVTASKTESARQQGPVLRASGRTAAVVPARRRWVPPSSLRHHQVPDGDAKLHFIFRKVRGILNKLTPEKFQKLSDDLLGLELDSDKVLNDVIVLIFEKALDEPKYSSMYAQLCKRLSEEAPNLELPGQPCTFKVLLLNKCRAEFENRAQVFAAFDERPTLTTEEEERRHLAKCKMLGNIKFIGELGKLDILAESTLHRCIQTLLACRAVAEHHEDLECLAQLVKTCGRVLDSERGRGLMEQYFARMETLSQSRDLAPRIRFMLRDVVELRRGGWVPRAAISGEGPVPIHQLRGDEEFHAPPPPPHAAREPLFRAGLRARGLDDVLGGLSLASPATSLVPAPSDKLYGGNGYGAGRAPAGDAYRQRSAGGYYARTGGGYNKPGQGAPSATKEAAPRFSKSRLAAGTTLEDVQMRPAANSLLFTANKLSKQQQPAPMPLTPVQQNVLSPAFAHSPAMVKEPAITIKAANEKSAKSRKDKGLTKEEVCRLALEAAADEAAAAGAGEAGGAAGARLCELQLPDKLLRRAIAALLEHALAEDASPAAACAVVRSIKRAPVLEPLRALLAAKHAHPRIHQLLAHAILQKLVSLSEVGTLCSEALLLEVLQVLKELVGLERLQALFTESKLSLATGPAGAALAEAVEARGLSSLMPQLRVQAELARAISAEPAPAALYRWIKSNVDASVRGNAAFVSALVALLAQHIAQEAGAALDREKALVEAYAPLLTALLQARPDLQLAAVYAVQVHAHHHRYPKGLLLRWFMYLYNLEVCEEEAFLRWREDVTDAYPGKGEALFQVNTWLTWLQQQESEDEEAED